MNISSFARFEDKNEKNVSEGTQTLLVCQNVLLDISTVNGFAFLL